MEPLELHYSEYLIRDVIRSYCRQNIGLVWPITTAVMLLIAFYTMMNGDRSWYVVTYVFVAILSFIIMIANYKVHLSRSLKRFKRMKTPVATLELMEEWFRISSDVGSLEIKWAQIKHIFCFNEAWIVFFSASDFMILPIENFSIETKNFITSKAKKQGATVV